MAKYHLTKKAVSDLDKIWNYTFSTWGENQADKYYNALIDTFSTISKYPCNLDKEYTEIHSGLYSRPCGKQLVFYRNIGSSEVEIVRILHQMMDIKSKIL